MLPGAANGAIVAGTGQAVVSYVDRSASGEADLGEGGILTITISRFMGDEATFKARRW